MRQRMAVDPLDFSPALLRIQGQPPAPLARTMLCRLLALLSRLILWSIFGHLDIVATAEGKLLPQSYLKIVQPAEQGVIRDILVAEGETVKAGQVLMRLDATLSDADGKALGADQQGKKLALRRIAAELSGKPFTYQPGEPEDLFQQTLAQYRANRTAYETALSQEQSAADKARSDLAAAQEIRTKLLQTLPCERRSKSGESWRQGRISGCRTLIPDFDGSIWLEREGCGEMS